MSDTTLNKRHFVTLRSVKESDGLLIRNHRQEALSRAYIQALAARTGLLSSTRDFDYGIDLTLHEVAVREGRYIESRSKLDLQVKTIAGEKPSRDELRYDLDVQSYDDLRDPNVGCPRILVVMELPREEEQWLSQSPEALSLRYCAYWISLRGRPRTRNRRSIRIRIPRNNVLSVHCIQNMIERARNGEEL